MAPRRGKPANARRRLGEDIEDVDYGLGLGGWRVPPHIRKAHGHRVRIFGRSQFGDVINCRTGIEGVDWHYELRWYPSATISHWQSERMCARDVTRSSMHVRRRLC